jgi:nitrile hydratase subunit beta
VRFHAGDQVQVKTFDAAGHVRTPAYVRGKPGWIERVHGEFRNPESLAYGGDGLPRTPLYMVGFRQSDVWRERYRESGGDKLYVDVYEHWLEPR